MYSPLQILKGIKEPAKIGYEANRLCHTRGGQYSRNPRGQNFLEEDWDNLIILDACRYDLFAKYTDLPGTLEHRYSLGSATKQFVRENFKDKTLHDTVYVGANTWFLKLQDDINTEVHHFVDLQNGNHDVEWVDKDLKVVTPETVTRHGKRINEEYPSKRLIIHYLQPHHPFIGPIGRKHLSHQSSSLKEVVRMADENVDRQLVRRAYIENLKQVLAAVRNLLPELTGKTVVTADHGEMLGERFRYVPIRGYGHPTGIYNDYTTKVPWNVIDADERKEIYEEKPTRKQEVDMEAVNDQLRDLGYVVS